MDNLIQFLLTGPGQFLCSLLYVQYYGNLTCDMCAIVAIGDYWIRPLDAAHCEFYWIPNPIHWLSNWLSGHTSLALEASPRPWWTGQEDRN